MRIWLLVGGSVNRHTITSETDLAIAREALRTGQEPAPTILTSLSKTDWSALSNLWSRGCDWIVWKERANCWGVPGLVPGQPRFKTKELAYEFITNLVLAESLHRKWLTGRGPS